MIPQDDIPKQERLRRQCATFQEQHVLLIGHPFRGFHQDQRLYDRVKKAGHITALFPSGEAPEKKPCPKGRSTYVVSEWAGSCAGMAIATACARGHSGHSRAFSALAESRSSFL
jgi:hypothetical protein